MKKITVFIFLLLGYVNLHADDGIQFSSGSWSEILSTAKKENKLVFIDVFTSWCGPCKMMVAEVFPKKPVGDLFNASFINYKIDAEKGEGIAVAKKYGVVAYPTYLFVDGDGQLVYKLSGYRPVSEFLKEANIALKEKSDPKPIAKWDAEYQKGKMSKEFLLGYLKKRELLKLPSAEIIEEVFPKLSKEDLANKETLSTVLFSDLSAQYVPQGKAFNYVLKNYKYLDSSKLLNNSLNMMLSGIFSYLHKNIVVNKREDMLPATINAYKEIQTELKMPPADLEASIKELPFIYYSLTKDKERIGPVVIDFVQNGLMKLDIEGYKKNDEVNFTKFMEPYLTGKVDSVKDENYKAKSRISKHTQMLNVSYKTRDAAEAVYNLSEDQDLLMQARDWARLSNEWFPHFSNGAVYAGLLFRTGEKQKAIEVMEVASRDSFLSGVPDVQKLLKDNVELMKKDQAPKSLWKISR